MNYSKMLEAYSNSEQKAIVEAEDSHAMVLLLFDELIKTLRIFSENIDVEKGNPNLKSKNMSRALTIIYALQSSLDFEHGGEIAENLFRLYEYARQQVIAEAKTNEASGTLVAIASLEDIREAWAEIRTIL